MNMSYNKAYSDLLKLVDEIEDDAIQLDALAVKVKQAKELIEYCETNLRKIETDVNDAISGKKQPGKSKKQQE